MQASSQILKNDVIRPHGAWTAQGRQQVDRNLFDESLDVKRGWREVITEITKDKSFLLYDFILPGYTRNAADCYIQHLENKPESLGEIVTLEQFVIVLGCWVCALKTNYKEYSALELKRKKSRESFFKVLGYYYAILQERYGLLEEILLQSCLPDFEIDEKYRTEIKKIITKKCDDQKEEKSSYIAFAITAARYHLVKFFSERVFDSSDNTFDFFQHCPQAIKSFLPSTIEKLAKKSFVSARFILASPGLSDLVSPNLASNLYKNCPQQLAWFLFSGFSGKKTFPVEFLIKHRDWIGGEHLLEIMGGFLRTEPPNVIKNYLYGERDSNGIKPYQKLKGIIEKIMDQKYDEKDLDRENKKDLTNHKLISFLDNDLVRGWINLSGGQWRKWAKSSNYHPAVCRLIVQNREFYEKTKRDDLKEEKECSPYLRAHVELHRAIEGESGWWEAARIDNFFARWKEQESLDIATCFIVASHEHYWKRIVPAPQSNGWFFGLFGRREQAQVERERIELAKKNPVFALKLMHMPLTNFKEILKLKDAPHQQYWWDNEKLKEMSLKLQGKSAENDFVLKALQTELARRFEEHKKESDQLDMKNEIKVEDKIKQEIELEQIKKLIRFCGFLRIPFETATIDKIKEEMAQWKKEYEDWNKEKNAALKSNKKILPVFCTLDKEVFLEEYDEILSMLMSKILKDGLLQELRLDVYRKKFLIINQIDLLYESGKEDREKVREQISDLKESWKATSVSSESALSTGFQSIFEKMLLAEQKRLEENNKPLDWFPSVKPVEKPRVILDQDDEHHRALTKEQLDLLDAVREYGYACAWFGVRVSDDCKLPDSEEERIRAEYRAYIFKNHPDKLLKDHKVDEEIHERILENCQSQFNKKYNNPDLRRKILDQVGTLDVEPSTIKTEIFKKTMRLYKIIQEMRKTIKTKEYGELINSHLKILILKYVTKGYNKGVNDLSGQCVYLLNMTASWSVATRFVGRHYQQIPSLTAAARESGVGFFRDVTDSAPSVAAVSSGVNHGRSVSPSPNTH